MAEGPRSTTGPSGRLDWSAFPRQHAEHRTGRDTDTRIVDLSLEQQDYIMLHWEELGGSVKRESDPVHFHLRYRLPE